MSSGVIELIDVVFHLLNAHDIPGCIIGELALNYYNVPRELHVSERWFPRFCLTTNYDLEISVRQDDLRRATLVLEAEIDSFELANEDSFNVYTEYRRGLPRFRFRHRSALCVVLFPDEPSGYRNLVDNIIPLSSHRPDSEYSSELLDFVPGDRLTSLPIPFLGPLLSMSCRKYMTLQDTMAGMAIEGLIDGMDLDEIWCSRNLTDIEPNSLAYVLAKIRAKPFRMDYYSPNVVTCIVANHEERESLLHVPGRDIQTSLHDKPSPSLAAKVWNQAAEVYLYPLIRGALQFLERHRHDLPHRL